MQNSAKLVPRPDNYRNIRENCSRPDSIPHTRQLGFRLVLHGERQGAWYTRRKVPHPSHQSVASSVYPANAGNLYGVHIALAG